MKTIPKLLLTLAFSLYVHSGFSQNPIIKDFFTADPAPIVHKDVVYLYTSHDAASVTSTNYEMKDWLVFSSTDMVTWEHKGIIMESVPNSFTVHPGVISYKGKDYFFYHNGALPTGGSYRRSICIDYMYYNEDGTIQKVIQTKEGVHAIR